MGDRKWAVAVILAACASGWAAGATTQDSVDEARTALDRWIETRRVISKERQDWAVGQEMLNERIDLVQREIASLREKIAQAQESIGDADKKRVALVEENDRLKKADDVLGGIVAKQEAGTARLIQRLPDPIRDRIKPLSRSLPKDPNDTKLSLAQRFQNVIGILNEVNKFNQEITVTSEVRTLADYVGANGTAAGVGRPSEDGWKWEPVGDAAGSIADAVAILKNEKVANFVLLPVKVQ
jgi:FtsZ-binding cell division protein ZapB